MSEENVEIVRRVFEAVARGDTPHAILDFYDPEVEWDASQSPYRTLLGRDVYRGHDGLRRFFREYREPWTAIEDEYDELIDAGDRVITVGSTRARGQASGAEVEATHQAGVWTVRDGKIVHVKWFSTRADALAAAGLSE